jgi:hypothetical protein
MGRWTGQKVRLKGNRTLSIITAYRLCKKINTNNESTSMATFRQQSIMLIEDGFSAPDPRKIFIKDMIDLIKQLNQNTDNYTIMMLDANENIHDSEGGIELLLRENKLIDTFSEIGKDECNITTYVRGSRKIDYIFTSTELFPYLKHMGCLTFYMYNDSDHRGLFLYITTDLLDNKVELKLPDKRYIGNNSTTKDKYNYKNIYRRSVLSPYYI